MIKWNIWHILGQTDKCLTADIPNIWHVMVLLSPAMKWCGRHLVLHLSIPTPNDSPVLASSTQITHSRGIHVTWEHFIACDKNQFGPTDFHLVR